ncbi:hypothetical protein BH10BAC3_BH10BAC3_02800 [soil metagenome]
MGKELFKYNKGELTVTWKPAVCIHSKICWHYLPAVFNPSKRPWINTDGATAEQIIAQVKQCPSGALSYELKTGQPAEDSVSVPVKLETDAASPLKIECLKNGPLLVRGSLLVKKSDGTESLKDGSVTFCRCGGSANKPYCDGSHRNNGFKD